MGVRVYALLEHVRRRVSMLVNNQSWKPRYVVRPFDDPPKLQGRTGAIRLRHQQGDVTAIVMYWPPKPHDASGRVTCAETLHGLAGWLRKTLRDTKRSTPCIMTDVNDRMGVPRNDTENQAVTRDFLPEKKWLAASLLRDIVQEEGMAVINTFPG